MTRKPIVGDIVHYVTPPSFPRRDCHLAAIVTAVHTDRTVSLTVFAAGHALETPSVDIALGHTVVCLGVCHDETHGGGTWHWPEPAAPTTPEGA